MPGGDCPFRVALACVKDKTMARIYTTTIGNVTVTARAIYADDGSVSYDITHNGAVVATAARAGGNGAFVVNGLGLKGVVAPRMTQNGGVLSRVALAVKSSNASPARLRKVQPATVELGAATASLGQNTAA